MSYDILVSELDDTKDLFCHVDTYVNALRKLLDKHTQEIKRKTSLLPHAP